MSLSKDEIVPENILQGYHYFVEHFRDLYSKIVTEKPYILFSQVTLILIQYNGGLKVIVIMKVLSTMVA